MNAYDFAAPRKIVFGWGRRGELGAVVRSLGRRALVVRGSRTLSSAGRDAWLIDSLSAADVERVELFSITREPLVADVDAAVARLAEVAAGPDDVVVALGGGSAIDLAKAVAALARNALGASVIDFLEGVGRGRQIVLPPLAVVAIPTTAGTGSEATKNAVISSLSPAFKKSLRADAMIPAVALVDPELTVSLPPATTVYTGMDAVTQLVESYISRRARPIPQALALAALRAALAALPRAVRDGHDRPAREAMAHAALVSGMCLANSGLGLAHGVAAALGVHASVPHGLACAVMLPYALAANRQAAQRQLAELGRALHAPGQNDSLAADWFCEQILALCRQLGVPERLSELGVQREQIPELLKGARGNSLSANPRDVPDAELLELLERAW